MFCPPPCVEIGGLLTFWDPVCAVYILDDISDCFHQSNDHFGTINRSENDFSSYRSFNVNATYIVFEFGPELKAVEHCGFILALVTYIKGCFLCTGCSDEVSSIMASRIGSVYKPVIANLAQILHRLYTKFQIGMRYSQNHATALL